MNNFLNQHSCAPSPDGVRAFPDCTTSASHCSKPERPHLKHTAKVRVQAKYHEEVAYWLEVLAGPQLENLLKWISQITNLNEPCAALYLYGPGRTGKTLLERGLTRIWTDSKRPVPHRVGCLRYNQDILECPLITDSLDNWAHTQESLKFEVFARQQTILQKHKENRSVEGCIRVILTSNGHYDVDPEYVLPIKVSLEARHYLDALRTERLNFWVEGDFIAEHAMWLVENFDVPSKITRRVSEIQEGASVLLNDQAWKVASIEGPFAILESFYVPTARTTVPLSSLRALTNTPTSRVKAKSDLRSMAKGVTNWSALVNDAYTLGRLALGPRRDATETCPDWAAATKSLPVFELLNLMQAKAEPQAAPSNNWLAKAEEQARKNDQLLDKLMHLEAQIEDLQQQRADLKSVRDKTWLFWKRKVRCQLEGKNVILFMAWEEDFDFTTFCSQYELFKKEAPSTFRYEVRFE